MNVSKQYSRLSLLSLIGVPAICLLASPVLAQSGFVPIGKPQAPTNSRTIQHNFVPANPAQTRKRGEFGSSDSLRPLGTPSTMPSNNRQNFGGLNYAAPQNVSDSKVKAVPALPPPETLKSATPFKTSASPQSFGSPQASPTPRSLDTAQSFRGSSQNDSSSSSSSSSKAQIDVDTCSVHLIDDIEIPAKESGLLLEMNVKEGDAVPANKIIGTIDATLLQIELEKSVAKLDIAREMASDTSAIDVAMKKYALAKHEYEVAARLASKGSKSNQERMRAKYSKDASAAEVTVAKMQQREALGQARIEEVNVQQIRQLISNLRVETGFDGQVLELFKHTGEWVNKGDSIAHFARIDTVWVEGTVSADKCNIQDVMGQNTVITLKQAGGETVTFSGKIVSIPLKMEAAGSRFRVKAEVQNRFENGAWLLRPEAQLSMKIDLSPNTAKRNASRLNR